MYLMKDQKEEFVNGVEIKIIKKGNKMIVYINKGMLKGWYYKKGTCIYGNGTRKEAERIKKYFEE